jgi:DNA-binding LytR/AlgR family response regulator
MQVAIIEDELHNSRILEEMMHTLRPGWEICGTFESIKQSVDFLKLNTHPDLILMDIQLSDGTCFSIFDQVELQSNIIFTTAYDNYAIQAFKVNSIDYLLKPIKENDLEKALQKLESYHNRHKKMPVDYSEIVDAIRSEKKKYRKRFLINRGNSYFKINTNDIACFVSENKVTTAITFTNEKYVVDFTLDRLEEELDPDTFFRADRSSIIHIDIISRFEDYFGGKLMLKLKSPLNQKITVSRLKASAFKVWAGK